MLLSYNEILKRATEPQKYGEVYSQGKGLPIIEPFNKKNLQGVSYDVHLSETIMKQKNENNIIHLNSKSEIDDMFTECDIRNGYLLKPNEYILVSLVEKFNLPDDLSGHIRPRTTMTKLGLVITSQHLNPSFCGKVYVGLKNMSNCIIEIRPNISIAQCVFETFKTSIPQEHLYRNRKDSKYQEENMFIGSKIYEEYDEDVVRKAEKLIKDILNG